MLRKILPVLFLTMLTACSHRQSEQNELLGIIEKSFQLGREQYKALDRDLPDSLFPRTTDSSGTLITNKSQWWTSGFFPGSLWYLYEYSNDPEIKQAAQRRTGMLEKEKINTHDHDIGFKMYCSFGNQLRLLHDSSAIPVLITAAKSLSLRYDPTVGCIRSWGNINDRREFLVIIDNMMNLELLFWAARQTGDSSFYRVAVSHADKTIENHFRPDGSSYHVLVYDPSNGKVLQKKTAQGYGDESAWARGQAWGLYGYTMSYRETGIKPYLEQAKRIANFIIEHPNYPEDGIPYWDFNDPKIPDTYRDASAGAIIASALLELSEYLDDEEREKYSFAAKQIIRSLSTDAYRSGLNSNANFLLMHGVGHLPANSEVDVPLSYADYYYLESMMRLYKKF